MYRSTVASFSTISSRLTAGPSSWSGFKYHEYSVTQAKKKQALSMKHDKCFHAQFEKKYLGLMWIIERQDKARERNQKWERLNNATRKVFTIGLHEAEGVSRPRVPPANCSRLLHYQSSTKPIIPRSPSSMDWFFCLRGISPWSLSS